MIYELERYRNRKQEVRPPTMGANALDLLPQVGSRANLQPVMPGSSLVEPIQISDFLKRRQQTPSTEPGNKEALMRKKALDASEKVETGKFIENEIDPDKPWSAFGQVMFIKEHIIDGVSVKKIAAISVAYPGGVGTIMAGEALSKTSGIDQSQFESWNGEERGRIIGAAKEVPNALSEFGLMESFIVNSGAAIKDNHAQAEHEVVQHFFDLQKPRLDFLKTVQKYAAEILNNPEFTGWSAISEEFKDKGIYLVEGIVENNEWKGGDPNGKPVRLVGIAADKAHKEWLEWAEKKLVAIRGDGILVDAEDTETVQYCGGAGDSCEDNKGCSTFFEMMEGSKILEKNSKILEYNSVSGISGTFAASESSESYASGSTISGAGGGGYESENCATCGKDRYKDENGCKCSKKS